MPTLYAYTKYNDGVKTHTLLFPESEIGESPAAMQIATLPDGRTIVCLQDDAELPQDQPQEIAASIEELPNPLPQELRELIKQNSPHCWLIQQTGQEKIRARYTLDQELYFARIGVGAANGMYTPTESEIAEMAAFGQFVESIRTWERTERAKLGL